MGPLELFSILTKHHGPGFLNANFFHAAAKQQGVEEPP